MRLLHSSVIFFAVYHGLIAYPAPSNITYFWNFGIYSLVCLACPNYNRYISCYALYTGSTLAFASVEHIMRDVNYGWLFKVFTC